MAMGFLSKEETAVTKHQSKVSGFGNVYISAKDLHALEAAVVFESIAARQRQTKPDSQAPRCFRFTQ
jgi:hypothetical protein